MLLLDQRDGQFLYRIAPRKLGTPLDCHFQTFVLDSMQNADCGVTPLLEALEAHEDKDFDYVRFVTLDLLVGCPIHARPGIIGSPFHP
jgi:hypothetical protein